MPGSGRNSASGVSLILVGQRLAFLPCSLLGLLAGLVWILLLLLDIACRARKVIAQSFLLESFLREYCRKVLCH